MRVVLETAFQILGAPGSTAGRRNPSKSEAAGGWVFLRPLNAQPLPAAGASGVSEIGHLVGCRQIQKEVS